MEIVIVNPGMQISHDILERKSLGGSETAAILAAKSLRDRGHIVTVFGNLEKPEENGFIDPQGIRWVSLEQYKPFAETTEVDVIIGSRDPHIFSFTNQSKRNILWCHDLATYEATGPLTMFSWNIDEVWTVSEYHRQQYSKVTGYPLEKIWATRNGIKKVDGLIDLGRSSNLLLYAARPERGLINLVRPGGIMSMLPEYHLKVAFYDNWPEHMRGFYQHLMDCCSKLPNVEVIGPQTQSQLRQQMSMAAAYVYPTSFEEVSCIIAREAIEQKLPFFTTTVGALPETLGDCARYINWNKADIGSDMFCQTFARAVRDGLGGPLKDMLGAACARRTDLYWPEVVEAWEARFNPPPVAPFSVCKSLMMDGDVIPAYYYAHKNKLQYWVEHIQQFYPFVTGEVTISEHYKSVYELEEAKGVPERKQMVTLRGNPRYEEIKRLILQLSPATILEYGCAEGPIILGLAQEFPNISFTGIDIVESNIELCKKYAKENNINNVQFHVGDTDNWPEAVGGRYDLAIIAEVLEHTLKPWEVATKVEEYVLQGGYVIWTVPQGSWEWDGLLNNLSRQWGWRAHIWHVTKGMIRQMLADKQMVSLSNIPHHMAADGRMTGNLVACYAADGKPIPEVLPQDQIARARFRQTLSVCMIAMNDEENILRSLKSVIPIADEIRIAIGPSTDKTQEYVEDLMINNPQIKFEWIDVAKIEVGKFGFDDARNASVNGAECDWIFWIDSDEYYSGNSVRRYLRNNAFDSYAIHQHHFTCEPRGTPAQIDKPARIYRNNGTFQFYGKVHEHAEKGYNGGPGFVMVLGDVDIGHIGYVNEDVRKGRFSRNFPLLQWDRDVYPDRKLGKFLWFRDQYHRFAWLAQQGQVDEARKIAQEAVKFFIENKRDFLYIGNGPSASLHYYSEANRLLGRGQFVKLHLEMEGIGADYQGIFMDEKEALEVAEEAIKNQFEKRNSGYWR